MKTVLRAVFLILLGLNLESTCSLALPLEETSDQSISQEEDLARLRREKSRALAPYAISEWEARIQRWEKARLPASIFQNGWNGFRPLIGGMPSGSGWVFGAGYVAESEGETLRGEINGRYSSLGYTQLDARLDLPLPRNPLPFSSFVSGKQYKYTQLNCFGLGPDSDEEKRFFSQKGFEALSGLLVEIGTSLELTGEAGFLRTQAGPSEKGPPLDDLFPDLPGIGDGRTTFWSWGGKARIKAYDTWDFPHVGWDLIVEARRYDDRTLHQFSSNRFVAQFRAQVPLIHRNRRLAFRFRTVHIVADPDQEVPFYLMETLGGAQSLRGFHEYRFRDLRNLLINLEYRWELWPFTDLALFVDGGKVFPEFSDFNLKRLQWGYGGGIRIRGPGGMSFNIDLAGSKEGVKLHFGSGIRFQ
ncbi:MAG: BamA/TamA family outer membrane protein [Acidobacteriota bacterium]|nr:MAG: BamA/TamA family outer membrane protein [Acidobacteriota bacterium]